MPKRKSKILYIDTNVILDFVADSDNNVIVLMRSVKSRRWKLSTSTFAMIELADYRKNDLFLWEQLSKKRSLNSIIKKLKNPRTNKKLKDYHFDQVFDWLVNLQEELPNLGFLDLDTSKKKNEISSWKLAHDISVYSNLHAKDVIHLATAIAAAQNNQCDFFITRDGDLYNESKKLIEIIGVKSKLKVMKPKEFIEIYPPIRKN